MTFYYPASSYLSDFGQATKIGEFHNRHEANPRGLGPPPPNAYKRAVLKDPPKQFKVSVLPPKKFGTGWAYGVRVVSTVDDEVADRASISTHSAVSSSAYKEYEVWRRWDDCLWFQEVLGLEYSIQAREKRRRLEQGKGVKKNGVYLDSKQAASFDSLPPGPDPNSISLDIHNYIPKLSKKALLFRPNQAIIDQRQQQFASLIDALFAPQVPALIQDLRESRTVKNFFGWWRRDKDFVRKHGPGKGKSPEIPILDSVPFYLDTSDSSQIFSAPATSSQDLSSTRSKPSRPTTADATSSEYRWHRSRSHGRGDELSRRRRTTPAVAGSSTTLNASNAGSHESRSSPRASVYSALSSEMSPTVVMWDGHEHLNASDRISPNAVLDAFPQTPMVRETFENIQCPPSPEADSPILGLEALPEEPELELPPPRTPVHEQELETRPPIARSRGNSVSDSRHRNAFVISQEMMLGDAEIPEMPDRSPTSSNTGSVRLSSLFSQSAFVPSWRTSSSDLPPCISPRRSIDSCTTEGIDYSSTGSPVTPQSPWMSDDEAFAILGPGSKRNPRESIMSINSIMSDTSVDQVLPRSSMYKGAQPGDVSLMRSFSAGPRSRGHRSVPMSVPEEEVSPDDCDDVILESYLYGIEEMDAFDESESDGHNTYRESSQRPSSEEQPKSPQNRQPEQFYTPRASSSPPTPHAPSKEDASNSPTSPVVSASTVSLKLISIKAYLTEDVIIVFRTASESTYAEIRDKIHDKFANQEGISLRPDFSLAYLAPTPSRRATMGSVHPGAARKRAASVGSASTGESSLVSIPSQEVWDKVVRDSGGKLTLRVSA